MLQPIELLAPPRHDTSACATAKNVGRYRRVALILVGLLILLVGQAHLIASSHQMVIVFALVLCRLVRCSETVKDG